MNGKPCCEEDFDRIDEAFALLDEGEVEQAAAVYELILSQHPSEPQVVTLGGCIAVARGDADEAFRLFDRAADLDETYPIPLIDAAELMLELDDPEGCLRYCDLALPRSRDDFECLAEVHAFRAAALLDLDRVDEARTALDATRGLPLENADMLTRLAALWLDLDEPDASETCVRAALELDGNHADAHHTMGWVHEVRGEHDRMVAAWRKTREIDLQAPFAPWHLSEEAFARVAENALRELPPVARDKLVDVPILVDDVPSEDLVEEGLDPRLLGLFIGPPRTEQGTGDGQLVEPNCIRLFQRNLERVSDGPEQLAEEIRTTVLHETAHYFGLEDEDLENIGLG